MTSKSLDVYVNAVLVGKLVDEADGYVFTYLPGVPPELFVSLTMPVRPASYNWARGLHPYFQMNLPEGFKKERLCQRLGPHADVTDFGLLALTGRQTIGRVQVVPEGMPRDTSHPSLQLAELLASPDSRGQLYNFLESGLTDGVSGVMPKALQPGQKATAWTIDSILKVGPDYLPGLSINEYLCLAVARAAGLSVPRTQLSDDGEVLVVERFDRTGDGVVLGVEDFCSLEGEAPVNKYKSSLERVAARLNDYVPPERQPVMATQLFTLLLVNYALRNADAHLKNFALVYTSHDDVRLAPTYDVVTVTAYKEYAKDIPGLTLSGKKAWAAGKLLQQYGMTRLGLSKSTLNDCRQRVEHAVLQVVPQLADYTEKFPAFREVGKAMLAQWETGLRDILPDVKPGSPLPVPLVENSGLSDQKRVPRKRNPYINPDGPMSHKSR